MENLDDQILSSTVSESRASSKREKVNKSSAKSGIDVRSERSKSRFEHTSKLEKNSDDEEDESEDGSDMSDSNYAIRGEDLIYNPESSLRNWLKSRGKEHCIEF
jgi:hypothetical protein